MFTVEYDKLRGIVRLSVEGFWDVATVDAFAADLTPLLKKARADHGRALVLSDARNFPVQSAEVGIAFDRMETQMGHLRDRLAMVVGSALAKMQGQRAVAGSDTRFFDTPVAAEQWLLNAIS